MSKVKKAAAAVAKTSTSTEAKTEATKKKRHCRCAKTFKMRKDFFKWLYKVEKKKTSNKKKKCTKCKKRVSVTKALRYFAKNVAHGKKVSAEDKVQMLLQMAQLNLQ